MRYHLPGGPISFVTFQNRKKFSLTELGFRGLSSKKHGGLLFKNQDKKYYPNSS